MELICSVDTNFESAQPKSSNRNSIIICFYIKFTFVLFFIVIRPNQHVFFFSLESFDLYLFFALVQTLTPFLSLCFGNLLCNQRFDHLKDIQALKKKKTKKKKEMTKLVVSFSAYNVIFKLMPFITSCYTFRCAAVSVSFIVVVLSILPQCATLCHSVPHCATSTNAYTSLMNDI